MAGRWTTTAVLALLWTTAVVGAGHAQTCSADSQCPGAGMMRTMCAGNTLVTMRSVCAGSCQIVEVSRQACSGVCAGDRCTAAQALPPIVPLQCAPACSCRNNVLSFTTGLRTAAGGCDREVRRCAKGCSCDDRPRCL